MGVDTGVATWSLGERGGGGGRGTDNIDSVRDDARGTVVYSEELGHRMALEYSVELST